MALAISVLEGLPQLLKMAMVQTHWHSDFESVSLDLFSTSVNVPLSVWYLKFYCNPRIKAYLTNYLKSILWYIKISYRVSQKMHLKEMCDFLTLNMLQLALALIKTKITIFLTNWPKNPLFQWANVSSHYKLLIPHVKGAFSDQWVKKMVIFCFDQCQSQWLLF